MPITDPWQFYTMMGYPKAHPEQYFYYKQKVDTTVPITQKTRPTYSNAMKQRIQKIEKYARLRRQLPFIKAIYLCDSMSFNAANDGSDIDLFFITKHRAIRRARWCSVCIFRLLGMKRTLQKKSWLFDCIFYVDENHTDLEKIFCQPEDIYLTYRLAHLIPLYTQEQAGYNIYTHNTRIKKILPNFPMQQSISLPIQIRKWSWYIKRVGELALGYWLDNFWEYIIKTIWKPIVVRKTKKHGETGRWIIVTDTMLKFHNDKRKIIQSRRENLKHTTGEKK